MIVTNALQTIPPAEDQPGRHRSEAAFYGCTDMRAAYAEIREACIIESAKLGHGPAVADISLYGVLKSHVFFLSFKCSIHEHLAVKNTGICSHGRHANFRYLGLALRCHSPT